MIESLAEALPREQARVREVIAIYEGFPAGRLAASMMKLSMAKSEKAAASGDVAAMITAYEELKGYE